MGMFDTLRSSYDLGPGFHRDLQTKDLECCMCEYWIDPSGKLFQIDYSGTHDWQLDDKAESIVGRIKSVPNGNHGKVSPCAYLDRVIEVYPAKWDCKYAAYPRKYLFIEGGIVTEVRSARS